MSRYCQFVLGPAGCGKSTYCEAIQKHYAVAKRTVHVINLDPAAEVFNYTPLIDIKDLISLDDVMESELRLGPNGGLMYCMDYLIQELVWLRDALEEADAENIIVDCPGQIELYLSSNVMQQLVQALTSWGYNVCSVYVIDCRFALDPFNFCGVVMSSQDAMVKLETPFIMVMMKVDLLSKEARKKLYRYVDPDSLDEMMDEVEENSANKGRVHLFKKWISVMENYPKSEIMPLNLQKPGSMDVISTELDRIMQYDEEREHVDEREIEYMDENGPSDYKQG